MIDSIELVISDWEDGEGDPRILPLLRELQAKREELQLLKEAIQTHVPYVLATVDIGNIIASPKPGWPMVNGDRLSSSRKQLEFLLKKIAD